MYDGLSKFRLSIHLSRMRLKIIPLLVIALSMILR
nr:MAG TPA: hypothetical protein [Caudoviricetes sp.]